MPLGADKFHRCNKFETQSITFLILQQTTVSDKLFIS